MQYLYVRTFMMSQMHIYLSLIYQKRKHKGYFESHYKNTEAVAMQTLQNKCICIVTGQTRKPRPTEIIPHEKTVPLSQWKFTRRWYPSRFYAADQSGDTLAL